MASLLNSCKRSLCLGLRPLNGSWFYSSRSGRTSKWQSLGILLKLLLYSRTEMQATVGIIIRFLCLVQVTSYLRWFYWRGCAKQISMSIYGQPNLVSGKELESLMLSSWQGGSSIKPVLRKIINLYFLLLTRLKLLIALCLILCSSRSNALDCIVNSCRWSMLYIAHAFSSFTIMVKILQLNANHLALAKAARFRPFVWW